MTRSKLKGRYNLDRTTINFENYDKQHIKKVKVKNNTLTTLTLKCNR